MLVPIILLIFVYIFNLIDYFQTTYAIQLYGIGVELNPIGRFMLEAGYGWLVKIILVPILLIAIGFIVKYDKKQSWAIYFLFIFYLLLIISNFYQLL